MFGGAIGSWQSIQIVGSIEWACRRIKNQEKAKELGFGLELRCRWELWERLVWWFDINLYLEIASGVRRQTPSVKRRVQLLSWANLRRGRIQASGAGPSSRVKSSQVMDHARSSRIKSVLGLKISWRSSSRNRFDIGLVSSGIDWIIEWIIVIADASCFDMIFLALFICTQVLCRLQDFDCGLEGGLIFIYGEDVLVASFICWGNGVSDFWIIFPLSSLN